MTSGVPVEAPHSTHSFMFATCVRLNYRVTYWNHTRLLSAITALLRANNSSFSSSRAILRRLPQPDKPSQPTNSHASSQSGILINSPYCHPGSVRLQALYPSLEGSRYRLVWNL